MIIYDNREKVKMLQQNVSDLIKASTSLGNLKAMVRTLLCCVI